MREMYSFYSSKGIDSIRRRSCAESPCFVTPRFQLYRLMRSYAAVRVHSAGSVANGQDWRRARLAFSFRRIVGSGVFRVIAGVVTLAYMAGSQCMRSYFMSLVKRFLSGFCERDSFRSHGSVSYYVISSKVKVCKAPAKQSSSILDALFEIRCFR